MCGVRDAVRKGMREVVGGRVCGCLGEVVVRYLNLAGTERLFDVL